MRFGSLQAAGAGFAQVAQRGGVIAVAVLAGSATQTGYAALALGIALGATYAVLQAFTVSLPHLAGPERAAAGTGGRVDVAAARRGAARRRRSRAASWRLVLGCSSRRVRRRVPGAATAFGPACAWSCSHRSSALVVQVAALRLRPEAALATGVGAAVAFVVVAVVAVPAWDAAGGTAAALAGGAVASARRSPAARRSAPGGRRLFVGAAGSSALSVAS